MNDTNQIKFSVSKIVIIMAHLEIPGRARQALLYRDNYRIKMIFKE